MSIKSYRDLEVWQRGRILVKCIYKLTQQFPPEERFGLTAQLRRAAVSVPSNIAEGHSRNSTRDYIQFLSMAIGSLAEVDTQIILARDLEYVTDLQLKPIVEEVALVQRMLHALRNKLKAKLQLPNP